MYNQWEKLFPLVIHIGSGKKYNYWEFEYNYWKFEYNCWEFEYNCWEYEYNCWELGRTGGN